MGRIRIIVKDGYVNEAFSDDPGDEVVICDFDSDGDTDQIGAMELFVGKILMDLDEIDLEYITPSVFRA